MGLLELQSEVNRRRLMELQQQNFNRQQAQSLGLSNALSGLSANSMNNPLHDVNNSYQYYKRYDGSSSPSALVLDFKQSMQYSVDEWLKDVDILN